MVDVNCAMVCRAGCYQCPIVGRKRGGLGSDPGHSEICRSSFILNLFLFVDRFDEVLSRLIAYATIESNDSSCRRRRCQAITNRTAIGLIDSAELVEPRFSLRPYQCLLIPKLTSDKAGSHHSSQSYMHMLSFLRLLLSHTDPAESITEPLLMGQLASGSPEITSTYD